MSATGPAAANARVEGAPYLGVTASATGRRWLERLDDGGQRMALAMAQSEAVPEIVARILAGRGVRPGAAGAFLNPSLRQLMVDPSTLTDMDAAAERIADTVIGGERIVLFADYDVDGATSAALFTRYLAAAGVVAELYIPDRLFEGYGPNPEAIRGLAEAGRGLLITLDCGTTSHESLALARQVGFDVVVIDHHQAPSELPDVVALVNPNRGDDLSGLGQLAAVGVAFMTLVAVNRRLRIRGHFAGARAEPDLMQWLDLVALGTVCDVVPLSGLNRAFVVQGLKVMAGRRNAGLAALADVARLSGPPVPYHLGFLIGPRINAGGRIGDARLGAMLLASDDAATAAVAAATLDRLNQERQAMEAAMLAEAIAMAEAADAGASVTVVGSPDWHAGVVGLIAARLKERFQRPAFAFAFNRDGIGTGSGRSVAGVDLGAVVREAVGVGIALKGGGHAMAAGVTLQQDRMAAFSAFLEERLGADVAAAGAGRTLLADASLSAAGATLELAEMIEKAGPFGAGHPEPVFVFPAHRLGYTEPVGNGHIRVSLAGSGGASLKGMAFRAADTALGAALTGWRDRPVHIAGALSVDSWNGRRRMSLRIIDAALPEAMPGGIQ